MIGETGTGLTNVRPVQASRAVPYSRIVLFGHGNAESSLLNLKPVKVGWSLYGRKRKGT